MTTQNVLHKENIYRVTFDGAVGHPFWPNIRCTKVDRWDVSHGWLLADEQEYSEVVDGLSSEFLRYAK